MRQQVRVCCTKLLVWPRRHGLLAGLGSAAALAAFAAHGGAAGRSPEFDQGVEVRSVLDEARGRASASPVPEAPAPVPEPPEDGGLWVSFGRSDLVHPSGSGFPLSAPVLTSPRTAVFRVAEDQLPQLAEFMHERFGRCGGFFAHQSRQEAEADLSDPPPSRAAAYTIDQQAWVEPLMPRVREGELRATIETLAAHHNRYYQADTGVAAASWIRGRWQGLAGHLPGASARLHAHTGWKQPSVILTIPGSETPDEVVVLGGHLDSISGFFGGAGARAPGADDNASGIAVLTEAVRVLSEAGFRPRRTVEFMGYAAEEVGLRGSKEIAQQYAQQGRKVVGVIQFDMTNFKGSSGAVYLLTDNVNEGLTAFLGQLLNAYVRLPWANTRCGYACSDHASWTRSGFPASAAFESATGDMNRAIHTERDTLATSGGNAEHSVAFAKLAVAFASELAKTSASAPAARAPGGP